jgi:protein gp37
MSDLFHEKVPDEWIDRIFAVMALCRWHTFIVLTKRAERMRDYLRARGENGDPWIDAASKLLDGQQTRIDGRALEQFDDEYESIAPLLPNVHLGVSVENQETADERIPLLLQTPAAVRIVSYEPALGPVDLEPYLVDALHRIGRAPRMELDEIIVGGESGPGARPCDVEWIRSTVQQCAQAGVACFTKQLGARPTASARPLAVPQSADSIMRHGEYDPEPIAFNLATARAAT